MDQAFLKDQPGNGGLGKPSNHVLQIPAPIPKLSSTAELHRGFTQAYLEVHYNRVHVKEIRAFIHIIDRLRTELSCTSRTLVASVGVTREVTEY